MTTAQERLLALQIIQYRDYLAKTYNDAYEMLRRERRNLFKEELDHIREGMKKVKETLERKRKKKAAKLCSESGMALTNERLAELHTTDHHDEELFDSSDLRPMERRREETPAHVAEPTNGELWNEREVEENGRPTGRFVSGNVVNLSRRELSAEDISLLSKGLKFSPTPTDIDKAKLREDLEAFKRRLRLR